MANTAGHDGDLQKTIDLVLGNFLAVAKIVKTRSVRDLCNFRLVNRLFHSAASKRLRSVHEPIDLLSELRMESFLQTIRARVNHESSPFPFASFKLDLGDFSGDWLPTFVTEFGEFIHRLILSLAIASINQETVADRELKLLRIKQRLTVIFSSITHLEHFKLRSSISIHLTKSDILSLPETFPRLKSIHFEYYKCPPEDASSTPLMCYLIARAPILEYIHVPRMNPMFNQDEVMSALRLAHHHHRGRLPRVSFKSRIEADTLSALREFNAMSFPIRDFAVELVCGLKVEAEILNCVTWLAAQSSTVTSLCISLFKPRNQFRPAIPPLDTLKDLSLSCGKFAISGTDDSPIQVFLSNQFSYLHSLTLIRYSDRFGIFDQCYLPSVKVFGISGQRTEITTPWHTILPNLSSIQFCACDKDTLEVDEHNLTYIFNHFPRIIHLELNFDQHELRNCWDILTGRAPRARSVFFHEVHGGEVRQLEEPVNGVYQRASLSNFRALKTFRYWPRNQGNLDAILYMTRAGLLVPLDEIYLGVRAFLFRKRPEQKDEYSAELSRVHANVKWEH